MGSKKRKYRKKAVHQKRQVQLHPSFDFETREAITKESERRGITYSQLFNEMWDSYAKENGIQANGAAPEKTDNCQPMLNAVAKTQKSRPKNLVAEGDNYRFYCNSCLVMPECKDNSIALTVTSPPYWNAIDYDIHAQKGQDAWHRDRVYQSFGETFPEYIDKIGQVFSETLRVTIEGGFCAIVVGTILYNGKHYPTPMVITEKMREIGWDFHQDIIWNKVTAGVKRAGSFIQHRAMGYYYPNIMTEYILIFRKPGEIRRGKSIRSAVSSSDSVIEPALDINKLFTRDIANNVWHIAPIPPKQIDHPCPYPQELVRRLVVLYSKRGDVVLDPFLGSGQTALVALQEGRECVGYDIEESYLELAENRIIDPPTPRFNHLLAKFEKVPVHELQ